MTRDPKTLESLREKCLAQEQELIQLRLHLKYRDRDIKALRARLEVYESQTIAIPKAKDQKRMARLEGEVEKLRHMLGEAISHNAELEALIKCAKQNKVLHRR